MKVSRSLIGLLFLASCENEPVKIANFNRIFPDTSKTWAGRMTQEDFQLTRKLEKQIHLESMLNGVKQQELRIWSLSTSYDPQVVFILSESNSREWLLRRLAFNRSENDSIERDISRRISEQVIESLNLQTFWSLKSQSELTNGDSFGCLDGENLFIEIADSAKYQCMWYRCPETNKYKDSVFLLATDLWDGLTGLQIQNRKR